MNPSKSSSQDLLALHAKIVEILREREILRSSNNPTGDLAEYLFCEAYPSWKRQPNSHAGFDAIDNRGAKYQIKGRRCAVQDKSRMLGAIRNLKDKPFDVLAVVIFKEDYTVQHAALIPWAVVVKLAGEQQTHTNSHRFLLREDVWNKPGVRDVTRKLKSVKLR